MAWMWTGFCMVIISAALKGISVELLEAARVDGANEWQVFRGIIFPLLLPTLAVVATTMVITALKAFDIVYVMTGGNFDTKVIANQHDQGAVHERRTSDGPARSRSSCSSRSSRSWSSTSGGSRRRRRSDDGADRRSSRRPRAGRRQARAPVAVRSAADSTSRSSS